MPELTMPRLSDTMEEGTLSQWLMHEGDRVHRGDVVAVIETDKASMDLEAYDEGVLTRLLVTEGASVPIGTPIAVIGDGVPPPPVGPAAGGGLPSGGRPAAEAVAPTGPSAGEAVPPPAGEAVPPPAGEAVPPPAGEAVRPSTGETAGPAVREPVPPGPPPPFPQPPPQPVPPVPPQPIPSPPPQPAPPPPPEPVPQPPPQPEPTPPSGAEAGAGAGAGEGARMRVRTSPLARALARRHGIDPAAITGSGPGGRIVRADVEEAVRGLTARPPAGPAPLAAAAAVPTMGPAPPPGGPTGPPPVPSGPPAGPAAPGAAGAGLRAEDAEEVALSRVRRITAERLTRSTQQAPHFYLTMVADAGKLMDFRREINSRPAAGARVSVTDLLIKACATTLAGHPEVNASWAGTAILRHRRVHIGVAVAIEDGLVVPVIRDADHKPLTAVAHEAHALAEKARTRRLSPDEITGGTFTISNLGMFGIDHFTAVINPPEAAILAVGATTRAPVVRGDEVTIGTTMALTLSIDHRVVDGATGAAFLADLVKLIEDPLGIVV